MLPTEGLRDWVEFFVQTADLSQRWGVEDICKYHTAYCADEVVDLFDANNLGAETEPLGCAVPPVRRTRITEEQPVSA